MTLPRPGEQLHYIPAFNDRTLAKHPFVAQVVFVYNPHLVNVVVWGHRGEMVVKEKVHILDPGREIPIEGGVLVRPQDEAKALHALGVQVDELARTHEATRLAHANRMDDHSARLERLEVAKEPAKSGAHYGGIALLATQPAESEPAESEPAKS